MRCNKRVLADIVGISERTLTEYQHEGLPVLKIGSRGEENEYETADVITWLIARAMNKALLEKPRDRLDRIRADREELALAKDLDELAPIAYFEQAEAARVVATTVELLSLPEIFASEVAALHGVTVDPDLFRERIERALINLSRLDFDDDDPEQSEAAFEDEDGSAEGFGPRLVEVGASAEDDDEGMGD